MEKIKGLFQLEDGSWESLLKINIKKTAIEKEMNKKSKLGEKCILQQVYAKNTLVHQLLTQLHECHIPVRQWMNIDSLPEQIKEIVDYEDDKKIRFD